MNQPVPHSIAALSIKQPWSWLITHPELLMAAGLWPKEIENREWNTSYRGPLLIHAGKQVDEDVFDGFCLDGDYWIPLLGDDVFWTMPQARSDYELGGIIGIAQLRDVLTEAEADTRTCPWFVGPYAFELKQARALPFVPYRGMPSIFWVPASLVSL